MSSPETRRRITIAVAAVVIVGAVIVIYYRPAQGVTGNSANPATASATSSTTPADAPSGRAVDPARFSAGACVLLTSTSADRHLTVFIDAGHGGIDPGAVGATESGHQVDEADLTLAVELDAAATLRSAGFTVVVSRTAATSVVRLTASDVSGGLLSAQGAHDDVAARAECANEAHAQLLLGVYFDAGSSSANAGAVTGYDDARPFAQSNLRFANLLQNDVLAAMNSQGWDIPDEGVLVDTQLGSAITNAAVAYGHLMLLGPAQSGYFTTPSQMPGALIEPLFVTDPFEATIASSPSGQKVMAAGMAQAVEQYFAPPPTTHTTKPAQ